MTDNQMTIDFAAEPSHARADFVLGSCNAIAADWIDRWPDWPGRIRGLVVHGPADCGKSHLGAIWCETSHAPVITRLDAESDAMIGAQSHILLDHPMPGDDWPEDLFFHVLNRLAEGGGSVLILSRQPMGGLKWGLADLRSRLGGLAAAEITPPDDAVLVAVMQKHADDLGLALDGDIARYMSNRIERSFSAARHVVAQINNVALRRKKKVTLAMVRDILDTLEPRLI